MDILSVVRPCGDVPENACIEAGTNTSPSFSGLAPICRGRRVSWSSGMRRLRRRQPSSRGGT